MDRPPSDDQGTRLERLEREVTELAGLHKKARRDVLLLRWVVFALTMVPIAMIYAISSIRSGSIGIEDVFGSSIPKKVESKEFGLYNRDGKRVFFADYDKWGYPSLVFLDLDLNYRMGLKIHGDGSPGMVFYDGSGTRASFRMGEDGESQLHLLGRKQKGGIFLNVSSDGTPHLKMSDAEGRLVFEAPGASAGPPANETESALGRESAKPEKPARPRR